MIKKMHHCDGENCGRDFAYGMLAVRGGDPPKIYCENCARKKQIRGHAVVYGGGDGSKVSSVTKDRAQRKLKKLARATRRAEKN